MRKQTAEAIRDQIEWVICDTDLFGSGAGFGYLDGELTHWNGKGAKPIGVRESVSIFKRIETEADSSSGSPEAFLRWLTDLESDLGLAETVKN